MNSINMTDEERKAIDDPCCEVWTQICCAFHWHTFKDEPRLMTMAYIPSGGSQWRINHCPACGANVSGKLFTDHFINSSRLKLD